MRLNEVANSHKFCTYHLTKKTVLKKDYRISSLQRWGKPPRKEKGNEKSCVSGFYPLRRVSANDGRGNRKRSTGEESLLPKRTGPGIKNRRTPLEDPTGEKKESHSRGSLRYPAQCEN